MFAFTFKNVLGKLVDRFWLILDFQCVKEIQNSRAQIATSAVVPVTTIVHWVMVASRYGNC